MDGIRYIVMKLVKAALSTKTIQEAYLTVGLNDNMLFDIYGNIIDALYKLTGEDTETLESSVTYLAITAPLLTEERRAEMLMAEYRKNHPEQPRPNTIEPDKMRNMVKQNGGYMTPEGDWS